MIKDFESYEDARYVYLHPGEELGSEPIYLAESLLELPKRLLLLLLELDELN